MTDFKLNHDQIRFHSSPAGRPFAALFHELARLCAGDGDVSAIAAAEAEQER
mgnify:CR=1 FL=1